MRYSQVIEKIENINAKKGWYFEKINNIDKLLTRQTRQKREKTQMTKIKNKNGNIITDSKETKKDYRRVL